MPRKCKKRSLANIALTRALHALLQWKIYEFLLKEMELPATSILFIDDRAENIEAAQKLGFDEILFTSQNQLQKDLKKRGLIG